MHLRTWLDGGRGRATALAGHLDVTLSRVTQMADDGVPVKYMLAVREFTEGSVSLDEMVGARTPDPVKPPAEQGA
jgi:hypothetical protein